MRWGTQCETLGWRRIGGASVLLAVACAAGLAAPLKAAVPLGRVVAVDWTDAPLADAVQAEDAAAVAALLAGTVDVNARQPDGMTALHWAAYLDDERLVGELLRRGAAVNEANEYGVTPLEIACRNGVVSIVRQLLAAGADAKQQLAGGETCLMVAARTGKIDAVRALLDAGAEVNARQRKQQTALMWAAAEGHADVVRLLLNRGAQRDLRLKSGFDALFFAVRQGKRDVVQVLLDAGADVNATMQPERGGGGKGPVRGMSPLLLAIENGHFDLAAFLLQCGADPNDQRSGYAPLHALTWVRKPNRGDGPDGDPPPLGSGALSSLELARVLVEQGADVNLALRQGKSGRGRFNETGATAFLMASKTADLPYLKLLVKLGADPQKTNVDGGTALMAAAGLGTLAPTEEAGTEPEALAVAAWLLDFGFDVNAVDANGETAMHGAAYKSFPKMVAWLADQGARREVYDRPNKYGWTPLRIAQGYRPGNFKPSEETVLAIREAMQRGVK